MSTTTENFISRLLKDKELFKPVPGLMTHAEGYAAALLGALFPHHSRGSRSCTKDLEEELRGIRQTTLELAKTLEASAPERLASSFIEKLHPIYLTLLTDAEAILKGDPAARDIDEVITCYPGFFAVAIYRVAHELHLLDLPLFPRVLTEYAHQKTGIDIHPGARIGEAFSIDHGTGLVIGETSIIGKNVRIYQGVTLGGAVITKSLAHKKRHPTIEDGVVIYANATILGGETIIGAHSIIGGSTWITESVPPYSRVHHTPDITVRKGNAKPEWFKGETLHES